MDERKNGQTDERRTTNGRQTTTTKHHTVSDSVRVAARSHSPLPSRLAIGGSQRADRPDESRMTPGKTSYRGPPTGTTLHIKVRDRRTALSNRFHRCKPRRRHSFRFNFFPPASSSSSSSSWALSLSLCFPISSLWSLRFSRRLCSSVSRFFRSRLFIPTSPPPFSSFSPGSSSLSSAFRLVSSFSLPAPPPSPHPLSPGLLFLRREL